MLKYCFVGHYIPHTNIQQQNTLDAENCVQKLHYFKGIVCLGGIKIQFYMS